MQFQISASKAQGQRDTPAPFGWPSSMAIPLCGRVDVGCDMPLTKDTHTSGVPLLSPARCASRFAIIH